MNKLPSAQETSLVLGIPRNQEIIKSKHFNGLFIKVHINSAILSRPEAAVHNNEK
jgi:hypothetical protein